MTGATEKRGEAKRISLWRIGLELDLENVLVADNDG